MPVERITVAVLFEYPVLNGGERSMLAAIDTLAAQDPAIHFIALCPQKGELSDAIRQRAVRLVPFSVRNETGQRKTREDIQHELIAAIEHLKPDLLHANSLSMSRLSGSIAPKVNCPTTGHIRDIMKLSKAAIADVNRNSRLVAVSNATKQFHVLQGVNTEKIDVIYNGVVTAEFQPRASTGFLHDELQIPRTSKLILSVGQIGMRKGTDVIAKAAVRVCKERDDIHFVIVGERNSKKDEAVEFENQIELHIQRSGFTNRWHRLGRRSDVQLIMNEVVLLVHGARQEPLGRVLLEAAASGLPIIATDVGGTTEIVSDTISAVLIPPDDAEQLAKEIIRLMNDTQTRTQLAENALTRFHSQFDAEIAAGNLALFLSRMSAGSN